MSAQNSPAKTPLATASEPTGPRILVVDDSPIDRRLIGKILEQQMGVQAAYAGDGREALRQIAESPPMAVLTDLQMPIMDGLTLVTEIRQGYPKIPVVLMTAYGSEEVSIAALRAGASNYVPKKNVARDLVDTIRQVFAVVAGDHTRQRLMGCLTRSASDFRIENDPALLPPLIQLLQEEIERMDLCDETAKMRVGVALQEALANALYHGNLEVSTDLRQDDERVFYDLAEERRSLEPYRDRKISVTATFESSEARITIRDEGPGFDVSRIDRPIEPEDLLRVGGRGMLLIRTFMDEVVHNAEGNQVTLIKKGRPSCACRAPQAVRSA